MQNGPANKVLVALDLDYTHFNSKETSRVCWLGKEQEWIDFYHSQAAIAATFGVELYFMVITNKSHFDDHAEAAAKAFCKLLSLGNPFMYLQEQSEHWCLVRMEEHLQYESLHRDAKKRCTLTEAYSHFVVLPFKDKAPYILDLAQRHGIPANQCLLLDDMEMQLVAAREKGIETVSFEEFSPDSESSADILSSNREIDIIIAKKRELIAGKIKQIIQRNKPTHLVMVGPEETSTASAPPPLETINQGIIGAPFCPMLSQRIASDRSLVDCLNALSIQDNHPATNRHT